MRLFEAVVGPAIVTYLPYSPLLSLLWHIHGLAGCGASLGPSVRRLLHAYARSRNLAISSISGNY